MVAFFIRGYMDSPDILPSSLGGLQPFSEISEKQSRREKAGYIGRAVVLSSVGVTQIVSPIVILANAVRMVFNGVRLAFFAARKSYYRSLSKRTHALSFFKTSIEDQKKLQQKALGYLEKALYFTDVHKETIEDLKKNAHSMVVAFLSMIPLFGLLAGGAYASSVATKGKRSPEEALGEYLVGQVPGIQSVVKRIVFPLASPVSRAFSPFRSRDVLNRQKAQDLLKKYSQSRSSSLSSFLQSKYSEYDTIVSMAGGEQRKGEDDLSFTTRFCTSARELDIQKAGFEKVSIDIQRGDKKQHAITCLKLPHKPNEPSSKTMVLVGRAESIGSMMRNEAKWYQERGWNVLLVTLGGYPESGDAIDTSEQTTIQDMAGVLKYVEQQNNLHTIGVHGFCLGGALAMESARLSEKVGLVIVDKPLDYVPYSLANIWKNKWEGIPAIFRCIPSFLIRGIARAAFPSGKRVSGVVDKNKQPYSTDGYDLCRHVGTFQGTLVGIGGSQDKLLGLEKQRSLFQTTMTRTLCETHRKSVQQEQGFARSLYVPVVAPHKSITFSTLTFPEISTDEIDVVDYADVAARARIEQGLLRFADPEERIQSLVRLFEALPHIRDPIHKESMKADCKRAISEMSVEEKRKILSLLQKHIDSLSEWFQKSSQLQPQKEGLKKGLEVNQEFLSSALEDFGEVRNQAEMLVKACASALQRLTETPH